MCVGTTIFYVQYNFLLSIIKSLLEKMTEKHLLPKDDEHEVIQTLKHTLALLNNCRFSLGWNLTELVRTNYISLGFPV